MTSVLVAAGIGAAAIPLLVASASSAAPKPISVLRAQANQIAGRVVTINTKIEILSEEYDQAAGRMRSLEQQQSADASAFSSAQSKVKTDTSSLHQQAVNAYVEAGSTDGIATAFSTNASTLPVRQTYIAAASSNLDSAIAALHNSEITLSAKKATLATAAAKAKANAET